MSKDAYSALYKGTIFSTNDPKNRGRVQLRVPQVLGPSPSAWAEPTLPTDTEYQAQVGDRVWVQFEGGNVDHPVYFSRQLISVQDLAADAITGKTIRGGTIVGSVFKTAESGSRLEMGTNDTTNTLYAYSDSPYEVSPGGLSVGTTVQAPGTPDRRYEARTTLTSPQYRFGIHGSERSQASLTMYTGRGVSITERPISTIQLEADLVLMKLPEDRGGGLFTDLTRELYIGDWDEAFLEPGWDGYLTGKKATESRYYGRRYELRGLAQYTGAATSGPTILATYNSYYEPDETETFFEILGNNTPVTCRVEVGGGDIRLFGSLQTGAQISLNRLFWYF